MRMDSPCSPWFNNPCFAIAHSLKIEGLRADNSNRYGHPCTGRPAAHDDRPRDRINSSATGKDDTAEGRRFGGRFAQGFGSCRVLCEAAGTRFTPVSRFRRAAKECGQQTWQLEACGAKKASGSG